MHRKIRWKFGVLISTTAFLLGAAGPANAALVVHDLTDGATAEGMAQSLAGSGVTISNVTYTGAPVAAGTFSGGDGGSLIGFDEGVVMGSGSVQTKDTSTSCSKGVEGPNQCDSNTTSNGTPGDPDLTVASGKPTFDAAVLEFDFVPNASTVQFKYVFSSDEYNEFANTNFNDTFAFFVNGSNCALVPGTNDPVGVNTINGGNPLGTNPQNPQYYRNNDPSDGGGSIDTEVDGLTVVLTCQADVTPGETNHMKLAIADASDTSLDSNVFIQAGSFTSCQDRGCGTCGRQSSGHQGCSSGGGGGSSSSGSPSPAPAPSPSPSPGPGPGPGTTGPGTTGSPVFVSQLPPPELGVSFNVEPVSGKVFVSLPGSTTAGAGGAARSSRKRRRYIPLEQARQVPVGSFLDTRQGTARVTSATNFTGGTQFGDFGRGIFKLLQERRTGAVTELRLSGGSFAGCPSRRATRKAAGRRAQAARGRRIRSLRGRARGHFRTRGRYSAATVRGTSWQTIDRCDGTLTKVTSGKVSVRDFRRHRTVVVRTGRSYLAKAR